MNTELILYTTPEGEVKIDTVLMDETIWLTQKKMAELFDVQRPAITKHLKNIFESAELDEEVVSSVLEHTTYCTAVDYDKSTEQAQLFFKKVQNKMLWAITGKTAAELITDRSDPEKPNMGLTSWKGSIVRKADVGTAKNYLKAEEIKDLNEIVTMYLDYAERQARQRKTVTMEQWAEKLDAFLEFNEQDLLIHAGKVKAEVAKKTAEDRYDEFDEKRKRAEAIAADEEDIKELEEWEKQLLSKKEK